MKGDRGDLLLKRNGKIKKYKIKFFIFSVLGFLGVVIGAYVFTFYNSTFIRILFGSILIISLIISTFSLVLSYVSRPFIIFEKGMIYPAPPQVEWTIKKGLKYNYIRFDEIEEIHMKNDILMKIIFKNDDKCLTIYLKYIDNLDKELLIQTLKKSSLEDYKIVE